MEKNKKLIDRRSFLKKLGAGTAVAAGLAGCKATSEEKVSGESTHTGEIPTDQMTYRQFDNLGDDKVSILAYGCMRWPTMPSPDGNGTIIDQEQVNKLVDYAIEHGVNYFDTAPVYVQGKSEEATGIALSRHPRESYYVATKMSNQSRFDWDYCMEMYQNSFKRLRVDYIDFYLMHIVGIGGWDHFKERFLDNGLMEFLFKEREAGRIRHLGWSFHGDIKVFDYLLELQDKGEAKWDFVMIQMNYVDWFLADGSNTPAEYLYTELEKRNIPVCIMEPLLGGRLSKLPDYVVKRLKQARPQDSVASWAFRYAGTKKQILTVLSGMTYMEHLQDNIRTYAPLEPLTDEEMDFLYDTAKIIKSYPTIPCNDCKYCMPCPYGLDIPAILLHYNKCINEGTVPTSRMDKNYAKLRKAYLTSYDRQVEKLRQADRCTSCNQCSKHCPQNINIAREIVKIDEFIEKLKQNTLE